MFVQGDGRKAPTTLTVDAINSLRAGTARAHFDAAAEQLAHADLPTETRPDVTSPVAPDPTGNVDVAEQMVAMMIAADMHHVTSAALRAALTTYKSSVEMLSPQ
jgi:hypothetical protein